MLTKFNKFISGTYYSKSKKFRSDSDNGQYTRAVVSFLNNEGKFKKFKQNNFYKEILEHVTMEQGQTYLDILTARKDGFLQECISSDVLVADDLGTPTKYKYEGYSLPLSPTTLRYIKVASDLNFLFGKKINNVAEIGCGYGGQLLVSDKLLKMRKYFIYDLPEINKLIKKYVNHFLLDCDFYTGSINSPINGDIDLIVSNFAFSELPMQLQLKYIEKIMTNARSGYMMMNTGLTNESDRINVEQLISIFPDVSLFEEEPLTANNNYILVWGALNKLEESLPGLRKRS
jgi:putative sugar O-methyltransferase